MKFVKSNGMDISVFSLGTVQLGMDYGLGDYTAKPSQEYAFELLDRALDQGVNTLDTANNYGDSEKVIGAWLKTKEKKDRPFVVTKIGPFDHSTEEALRADMISQAKKCLETLDVDVIDMLMLHDYEDYEKNPKVVKEVMDQLKAEGLYKHSGISVYSRHDYSVVAKSGFDAVQIPINIFDWAQIDNGGIKQLADAGMTIFARSVFLQGLVFMNPDTLDPRMDFCVAPLRKFLEFCEEFKMSPAVLAMSFVLSIQGITSMVLGCQRTEQIDNNCELVDQVRKLTEEEMSKIHDAFAKMDPRVTNPGVWFNHT